MERIFPDAWGDAWRRLSHHWSILFTAAVVIWFAFSALSFPDIHFDNPLAKDSGETRTVAAEPEASTGTSTGTSTSSMVDVKSFHVDAGPPVAAEITLEIHNDTRSTMSFRTDGLVLRRVGGQSYSPTKIETSKIDVAAGRSMIVPVTFPVGAVRPGASYELTYMGNSVYTGAPI